MKFDIAIPFKMNYELNDKAQEFNIYFDPDKNNFNTLIEFIQEYKDKRIDIEYRNGIDVKTASALAKVGDNVAFRLHGEDVLKTDALKSRGCKFFFDSTVAVTNWITLKRFVETVGVTDVYVADDLVYELDNVRDYCTKNGVSMRCVINRVPITEKLKQGSYIAPMYRPQDVPFLETVYDVAEFDCGTPCDFKKLSVMYRVYIEKKNWYGQLGELNPDFDGVDVPCPDIMDGLAEKRSKCALRCLRGGSCRTCKLVTDTARSLRDIGGRFA